MRHPLVEEDLERIISADLPWEKLKGKTVLVTGAAGMLPAYMVETILFLNEKRKGQFTQVIGLVRNRERAMERFAAYQGRNDLGFVDQDVLEKPNIPRHVDYVIHAASVASPKYYGVNPVGTLSANVLGTNHLLNFANERRVDGFLFLSSGEVYGQVDDAHIPTDEKSYGWLDPMDVRSCYGESKRMGETMCVAWAHQYGVPAKIVRPFHTYGPGMRLDDGRVFADFIADIIGGRDIVMSSDGSARRAFCYLADATIGFFTVMFRGEIGQAYNVGNDEGELSVLELAKALVGLFPEKKLKVIHGEAKPQGYLKSKISRNCPNISKIRSLGWGPVTSISEGFSRTIKVLSSTLRGI